MFHATGYMKTMSTTRKIAHNTAIQFAGKAISTVLGLLAIGMMSRYLGQEQFGWYVTTIAFLQFIGILIDFGMTPVTAKLLSEQPDNKETLMANLLSFRLLTALVCYALAPALAMLFPYPAPVKLAIAINAIAFVGIAVNQIMIGLYQTRLSMHIPVIGDLISRVLLVGGIWLAMRGYGGFLFIMTVIAIQNIAGTLYLLTRAARIAPVRLGFNWRVWQSILTVSWPIAISIIFNVMYLRGDTVILSVLRSQAEVGIYGAAYRVIDVITQSAMMLMGILLPLLSSAWAQKNAVQFRREYQRAFDLTMVFALPVTVALWLLAHPIVKLVFGEKFAASGDILRILAMAAFGVYIGAIFGHMAVAINRQKQTIWIYLSDAVLSLIGYAIFIPRYGIYGAAWMSVFSEVYAGVLLTLVIRHYAREQLSLGTLGKTLIATLAMAAVLIALKNTHIILLMSAGIITFGASALALRIVSKETLKEILSLKPANV